MDARRQEMKSNAVFVCMFVCMFVTLDVQERGPDVQQRTMSPFVDQCQCGFQYLYRKKLAFQLSAEISTILVGTTLFEGIGENFEKFSTTDGKVCENDFDHLGAAYNKSFTRPL